MGKNELPITIIAVMMTAIIITAVAIPTITNNIGDIGKREKITIENIGISVTEGSVTDNYLVQWDNLVPGSVVINGTQVTVNFDPVGGTVAPSSKTVTEGLSYGEMPTPTKKGYAFVGWFTSTEYTTMVTSDTIVTGSEARTLYASWIESIEGIKMVSVSNNSTWVVTTDGKLYGTGLNTDGQQGSGDTTKVTVFTQRLTDETIASVSASDTTTWVITTDGKLYGTGDGALGKQGSGSTEDVTVFTERLVGVKVKQVVATAYTTWAVDENGHLWGCGSSQYGQQGYGGTNNITTFTDRTPSGVTVKEVFASNFTTWIIDNNDHLWGCGRGNTQGHGSADNVTTFTQRLTNETVSSVSATISTTWVVTTDGKLYGTGDGSNGQQGTGTHGSTVMILDFEQRLTGETIASVSASNNTTWAVTTDGRLYGTGINGAGQQSSGDTSTIDTFTLRLDNVASVKATNNTTWAVTMDNRLYGCGSGSLGQQGNGKSGTSGNVSTFTERLAGIEIANYFSGSNGSTSWAVTTDGRIFGCGNGENGQQGSGGVANVLVFTQRLAGLMITSITSSDYTTWLLDSNGHVWGCGSNNYGQQGSGSSLNIATFTDRTPSGVTITSIVASNFTTWLLDSNGHVWGCGNGAYGQQGNGNTLNIATFADRTPSGKTIVSIAASNYTTWLLDSNGHIWGCGNGAYGQQGNGSYEQVSIFTDRTPSGVTVASISVSDATTWFVDSNGHVWGCGAGNNGQQSNGSTMEVSTFTDRTPNDVTVVQVIAGYYVTWILDSNGLIWGCGSNYYGQQGNGSTDNVLTFENNLNGTITSISASNDSTWAIDNNGHVWGCGNGAYGQQGSGDTAIVKTFTDRTPSGKTIVSVSASDSTTWLLDSDGHVWGCGLGDRGQQGSGEFNNHTTFADRTPSGISMATVRATATTTWLLDTGGYAWGCGKNAEGQQGKGDTGDVSTFTQRTFNYPINLISVSPLAVSVESPSFVMGGENWMICITGSGIALYNAGLTEPMEWTTKVTFSFNNGTMTIDNYTMPYTSIYYKTVYDKHASESAAKFVVSEGTTYIKADTPILSYFTPTTDSGALVKGTMIATDVTSIADGTVTLGAATVGTEEYRGDIFTVTGISLAYDGDQTATPLAVIVADSVSYFDIVPDTTLQSVISLVPVLLLLALVGFIGVTIYKKV